MSYDTNHFSQRVGAEHVPSIITFSFNPTWVQFGEIFSNQPDSLSWSCGEGANERQVRCIQISREWIWIINWEQHSRSKTNEWLLALWFSAEHSEKVQFNGLQVARRRSTIVQDVGGSSDSNTNHKWFFPIASTCPQGKNTEDAMDRSIVDAEEDMLCCCTSR